MPVVTTMALRLHQSTKNQVSITWSEWPCTKTIVPSSGGQKKCEGCFDRKKEGQGQDKAGAGEH